MRLVLASNNAKKLVEIRSLLAGLAVEAVGQGELGIPEADEPYSSFVENALVKARHASRLSGEAAIADDSGLCVVALGGLPGVDSATYAPLEAAAAEARETRRRLQDAANNALLLARLSGIADRRAHYTCVLVAIRHARDPEPLIATGRWAGEVLSAPDGDGGFGYDPLIRIGGETVARMSAERKNAQSHRALAMRAMRQQMRESWGLAEP